MTNDAMFSFGGEFSFSGVQDKLSSSINTSTQKKEKGLDSTMDQEMNNIGKQGVFNAADDWGRDSGGFGSLYSSDYGILYGNDDAVYSSDRIQYFPKYLQQQPLISSECGLFGDVMHFDALSASPPFQLQECLEEISKLRDMPTVLQLPNLEVEVMRKEKRETRPFSSLLAGLDLLNNYGSRGFKRFNGGRIFDESTAAEGSNHTTTTIIDHHYQDQDHPVAAAGKLKTLSTEEIVRVAGARFIRTSSSSSFTGQVSDATSSSSISMLSHPFEMSFSGLSEEETRDVELVEFLLASAEKVGYQQYERATKLLDRCDSLCSSTGRPVERLIFYFAEALRDKIDRETGIRRALVLTSLSSSFDIDKEMMRPNEATLACQTKIPFGQVVQFAGTQAIVEHVAEANKVHIIDLQIRNGVQWTGLMQALASRRDSEISSDHNCNRPVVQLELLKISAVGTTCNEDVIADTGRRLESFARSINLPFSFKTVTVPDMLDLKEDMFEIDPEETVAVYAAYALRSMIPQPDRLESAMRVIKNIRPCVTVVSEVEANHNSPVFVTRFIEALFFFGAYFDCVETCIEQNDPSRRILESQYFGNGIRSIVATEGEERKIRHVKIDVWRAFFARYGMEEIELSSSSLYQADLVIRNFSCGNSCTLNMDGKCLLVGWKGTPLNSLSLWKFL